MPSPKLAMYIFEFLGTLPEPRQQFEDALVKSPKCSCWPKSYFGRWAAPRHRCSICCKTTLSSWSLARRRVEQALLRVYTEELGFGHWRFAQLRGFPRGMSQTMLESCMDGFQERTRHCGKELWQLDDLLGTTSRS